MARGTADLDESSFLYQVGPRRVFKALDFYHSFNFSLLRLYLEKKVLYDDYDHLMVSVGSCVQILRVVCFTEQFR